MLIDVLSSVVPTPEAFGAAEATLARMRGYQQHFTSAGAKVPLVGDTSELRAAIESSDSRGRAACPTQEQFDGMLDDAGVSTAVVYTEYYETSLGIKTVSNDVVADYVARDPGRLLGLAGVDPWKDDAVSETQRALTELGLRGIVLSPFKQRLDPSDARMARVFSNLKIVALHCGWPWVEDMMMVAWRHANIYLDISAHRPKHMTIPDSGWSPLLYWGNRMLSNRVVFGSTWTLIGMSIKDLADEVRGLPLKDEVIERWLHGNAERLLGLG